MNKTVHAARDASALQEALHVHKVPYTLTYVYQDGQRDTMEYWKFEIPDPTKLFDAVITNVYRSYAS